MKTELSESDLKQYDRDGFIHVPGFLTAEEVQELKAAVMETVSLMGKRKVNDPDNPLESGDDYYDQVFIQRLNLWKINQTVGRYMINPQLGKLLCRLAGVRGIRCWHDQALIKQPFGNPTAWHLDNPYWSFTSDRSISIWIALEDATLYNGCMWFIPGTHRLALMAPHEGRYQNVEIGQNMGDLFKTYPQMGRIETVPVPMKAGDCSFHNGLTAHGVGANMTRGTRMAMTCAYMPEASTFNGQRNILPLKYFNTLKQGDILENNDWNPLLYTQTDNR